MMVSKFWKKIPDTWENLIRKLAYPYEYSNSNDDYKKLFDNLKEEDFFSKLKSDHQSGNEKERTEKNIKLFNI